MFHLPARLSFLVALLLVGCDPVLGDGTPGGGDSLPPFTPGEPAFAVLGPVESGGGAAVIVLDGNGTELARYATGNDVNPWEEWYLAWDPAGAFYVRENGSRMMHLDIESGEVQEFAVGWDNSEGRAAVRDDGRVAVVDGGVLSEFSVGGSLLRRFDDPEGWRDVLVDSDGTMFGAFGEGSVLRVPDDAEPTLVAEFAGGVDGLGLDGGGAFWSTGYPERLQWVLPGERPVEMQAARDQLRSWVPSIEGAGIESVFALSCEGSPSVVCGVSEVSRSGNVRDLFEEEQFWVDLVVLDARFVL